MLDGAANQTDIIDPPASGTVNVLGDLTVDPELEVGGFDFPANSRLFAYAVLRVAGVQSLYRITPFGGSALLIGNVGGGFTIKSLAVLSRAVPLELRSGQRASRPLSERQSGDRARHGAHHGARRRRRSRSRPWPSAESATGGSQFLLARRRILSEETSMPACDA